MQTGGFSTQIRDTFSQPWLWGEFACTLLMCGIVLHVQCITYPLFAEVGVENWPTFAAAYTNRAGLLIAPIMLVELTLVGWNLLHSRGQRGFAPLWVGAALLAGIWVSTFLIQVPLHEALAQQWDPQRAEQLVASNWIRTVGWLARAALLGWLIFRIGRLAASRN